MSQISRPHFLCVSFEYMQLLALLARSLAKCFVILLVCLQLTVALVTLQFF